jgi:hypothetical protein
MKTTALISFSFLAIAGCITETDAPTDPTAPADETIVKTPYTSCLGVTYLGGVDTYVSFPGSETTDDLSSYNPSTAPCLPGKWVVEVDGTAGKAPTPFVRYAGSWPLNPTACANSSVSGQVFGHLTSGWVAVGAPDRAFGVWGPRGCFVPHITFPQMTGYDRIAVSGAAYSDAAFDLTNVTNGAN